MPNYKQPKRVPVASGSGGGGYPEKDVGRKGVMVKGRWPSDSPMKGRKKMRGTGAALKGLMFYDEGSD